MLLYDMAQLTRKAYLMVQSYAQIYFEGYSIKYRTSYEVNSTQREFAEVVCAQ